MTGLVLEHHALELFSMEICQHFGEISLDNSYFMLTFFQSEQTLR